MFIYIYSGCVYLFFPLASVISCLFIIIFRSWPIWEGENWKTCKLYMHTRANLQSPSTTIESWLTNSRRKTKLVVVISNTWTSQSKELLVRPNVLIMKKKSSSYQLFLSNWSAFAHNGSCQRVSDIDLEEKRTVFPETCFISDCISLLDCLFSKTEVK